MLADAPNATDWIIAISGCFAAIGTVAAVTIALWQSRAQSRRSLHVTCSWAIAAPDSGSLELIAATATNTGYRPIKLTWAYVVTDDGRKVLARFVTWGTPEPLPVVLADGESVDVRWERAALEEVRAEDDSFDDFHAVVFTDAQGGEYFAPYVGRRARKRLRWDRGFRWKTEFVPVRRSSE